MIDQVKVDKSDKLRLPYLVGHDGVPKELQAAEKGLHGCKFSQLSLKQFLLLTSNTQGSHLFFFEHLH